MEHGVGRFTPLAAAFVASVVFGVRLFAQGAGVGVIEGTVREAGSGRPIEGAQVTLGAFRDVDRMREPDRLMPALGALTNRDGNFRIPNVPARTVELSARRIGYATVSRKVVVPAGATARQDFELQLSALQLEAVVTTGTAVATQVKHLGNTVAQVEPPQFAPIATTNELLAAREPGVVGLPTSGMTGTGARIRIRGNASLSQSNEPIIMVDGIRINSGGDFSAQIGDGGAGGPSRLDDIDPNSIERVEILKGAAATTLYGTEASNGVIQIFTKRGSVGKPKWDFRLQQDLLRYPTDRLQPNWGVPKSDSQAAALRAFYGRNDIHAYEKFNEPFGKRFYELGKATTGSAGLTGGTESFTYFVNGRYYAENGPYGGRGYGPAQDLVKRGNVTMNLGFVPFNSFRLGLRSSYTNVHQETPQNGNNVFAPYTLVLFGKPELAQCNDVADNHGDGTCRTAGGARAPGNTFGVQAFASPQEVQLIQLFQVVNRSITSLDASYQPFGALSWSSTIGIDVSTAENQVFEPFGINIDGIMENDVFGDRAVQDHSQRDITLDTKLNWTRDVWRLNSSFFVGAQAFHSKSNQPGAFAYDFPGPGINVVSAGAHHVAFEDVSETVQGGFFGQEQIGFGNWIFATVGARYDYGSTFGKAAGGVLHPQLSMSFVPSDAPSWKPRFGISSLRLRGAWGQSGRQAGAFDKATTFVALAGASGAGLVPGNLGNPDLKPETSTEIEGGMELGVWGDRVGVQYTHWAREVSDLLVAKQFPISSGFLDPQLANVGAMRARGDEIGLKAFVVQSKAWSFDLFANGAYLNQEVNSLGGAVPIKVGGDYPRYRNYIKEGYAPGWMFGAKLPRACSERPTGATYTCLNPGELPYDLNGDKHPDTEAQILASLATPLPLDKLIDGNAVLLVDEDGDGDFLDHSLGKPFPDWTGSWGANLSLGRSWRLYSLFEYKGGNYAYTCLVCAFRNSSVIGFNTRESAAVEEVMINPASTAVQRLAAAKAWLRIVALDAYDGLNQTFKGDFIRWRELSLTYTAPRHIAEKLGAREMSLSFTGRNLMLWTKYPGHDPEVSILSVGVAAGLENNFNEAIDGFGLPLPRRIAISLRLGY